MIKGFVIGLVLLMGTAAFGQLPADKSKIVDYLQDVSVTIKADRSQGSGVVINKGENTLVLTAGHVVEGVRKVKKKLVDGIEKSYVEFSDVLVIKKHLEDGREVGRSEFFAQVIKYSDKDEGHDLALLLVRKKGAFPTSVALSNEELSLGAELYHVGSLLGEDGSNSLTKGILSQKGRLVNNRVLDQGSLGAFPGSSGGGVFVKDTGALTAILVRGAGETYNLFVPARRLTEWANEAGVPWLFDVNAVAPSPLDLKKIPVE
jgi:S1-C subfamily serine protease